MYSCYKPPKDFFSLYWSCLCAGLLLKEVVIGVAEVVVAAAEGEEGRSETEGVRSFSQHRSSSRTLAGAVCV